MKKSRHHIRFLSALLFRAKGIKRSKNVYPITPSDGNRHAKEYGVRALGYCIAIDDPGDGTKTSVSNIRINAVMRDG